MTTPHEAAPSGHEHRLRSADGTFELTPIFLEGLAKLRRGEPLGWGATPLHPYLPAIASQQKGVRSHLTQLFNKPPFKVPEPFARYVYNWNQSRVTHRLDKNFESFSHRTQFDLTETPDELQEAQARVLAGHASPAEVIVVATQLGVPTFELASLTHPYGQRMEDLEPMREAVLESIRYCDGEIFDEPEETFRVKGFSYLDAPTDEGGDIPSLRITRTKTLAKLDEDTKVYERSSFVLRLDEAILSQIVGMEFNMAWAKEILKIPGFIEHIQAVLESDDFESAVPISTTTFAINERLVAEQLLNKETYDLRQRNITQGALKAGEAEMQRHLESYVQHPKPFRKGWMQTILNGIFSRA